MVDEEGCGSSRRCAALGSIGKLRCSILGAGLSVLPISFALLTFPLPLAA